MKNVFGFLHKVIEIAQLYLSVCFKKKRRYFVLAYMLVVMVLLWFTFKICTTGIIKLVLV